VHILYNLDQKTLKISKDACKEIVMHDTYALHVYNKEWVRIENETEVNRILASAAKAATHAQPEWKRKDSGFDTPWAF